MQAPKHVFLVVLILVFVLSACGSRQTAVQPSSVPTQVIVPETTLAPGIPQSEAAVPRVSIEEAKAALESGAAIIVDVRSPDAYATSHIAGAISVPLGEIERNLTSLTLEKDQWIITYCT